jgi:hypothetical protein
MQSKGLSSRARFVPDEEIICIRILIRYMNLAIDILSDVRTYINVYIHLVEIML